MFNSVLLLISELMREKCRWAVKVSDARQCLFISSGTALPRGLEILG